MAKKTMPALPATWDDKIQAAHTVRDDASRRLVEARSAVAAAALLAWTSANGCEACGGRGWIVTWDTLDSLSGCYAEYGACPAGDACTAATVGPKPGNRSLYEDRRCTPDPMPALYEADPECFRLEAALRAADADLDTVLQNARIVHGRKVVVARGRKVPVGLIGEVSWVGEGPWGRRVGVRDLSGTVHWTAASNVSALV